MPQDLVSVLWAQTGEKNNEVRFVRSFENYQL